MRSSSSFRRAGSAATLVIAGVAVTLPVAGPAAAATATYRTDRATVSSTGVQSDDYTISGDISGNGRYVVFGSGATNLVPGDTNGVDDIFLRDRQANTTIRISTGPAGEQANGYSSSPSISSDGRFVAFSSYATNLVTGADANDSADVFLLDREAGTIERLSETADGTPGDGDSRDPSLSGNGRYVTFETSAANLFPGRGTRNVALHDRTTGQLSLVNVEDGGDGVATGLLGSYWASISDNGRYVAFVSGEDDMVPGDTNGERDVFLRDLRAGTTTLVSVTTDGRQTPDGSMDPDVSNDGRYVTFWTYDGFVPGDTNGLADVYLRDVRAGTTRAISTSPDGRTADGSSTGARMTPDGRYVAFTSDANNIVPGDTNGASDIFVTDLQTGDRRIVSLRNNGAPSNGDSYNVSVSRNGRFFAYGSDARNLVKGDTNGQADLLVTRLTVS